MKQKDDLLASRNKNSNSSGDAPVDSSNSVEQFQCPNFPFFGASYPDAGCFDGYLRDLDACDENGLAYEHSENWPCPFCNTEAFIKQFAEYGYKI